MFKSVPQLYLSEHIVSTSPGIPTRLSIVLAWAQCQTVFISVSQLYLSEHNVRYIWHSSLTSSYPSTTSDRIDIRLFTLLTWTQRKTQYWHPSLLPTYLSTTSDTIDIRLFPLLTCAQHQTELTSVSSPLIAWAQPQTQLTSASSLSLPEHKVRLKSQFSVSLPVPVHVVPPNSGVGLSQSRIQPRVPTPLHVTEHALHACHTLHEPSTDTVNTVNLRSGENKRSKRSDDFHSGAIIQLVFWAQSTTRDHFRATGNFHKETHSWKDQQGRNKTWRTEWENGELSGEFMAWNTVERAIREKQNRIKSYTFCLLNTHSKHTVPEPFNVCSNHAPLNHRGQESKNALQTCVLETRSRSRNLYGLLDPSKVTITKSLKDLLKTVSAKKPTLKFWSNQKTRLLYPSNMCKSEW